VSDDFVSAEVGVFYLIQLEPEFDPGRFKVGFAAGMSERLRQLRCSAPFATVVRSWPCRRLWEKTAIESVSAGCERLHTEVFRTGSLDEIIERCERFFAVMPPVQSSTPNQALHLVSAHRTCRVLSGTFRRNLLRYRDFRHFCMASAL
jgi:hypothetical protein